MVHRKLFTAARRRLRSSRLLQIGLVVIFWLIGDALTRTTGWPLPGGILGMAILLLLFASGSLSHASLRHGANWFIAEMLLFFVPAVLAVLDHQELLGILGLKILAVIVLSTVLVMGVTALVVEFCFRAMSRLGGESHGVD